MVFDGAKCAPLLTVCAKARGDINALPCQCLSFLAVHKAVAPVLAFGVVKAQLVAVTDHQHIHIFHGVAQAVHLMLHIRVRVALFQHIHHAVQRCHILGNVANGVVDLPALAADIHKHADRHGEGDHKAGQQKKAPHQLFFQGELFEFSNHKRFLFTTAVFVPDSFLL